MSLDFALKDILRFGKQSSSYIKSIGLTIAVPVLFIYIFNGLGFTLFSNLNTLYNYTTSNIAYKYLKIILYLSMLLAILWTISINHSLIDHKTKDLAIMKAVGAIQSKLLGFYTAIVLIIDILGVVLGLILGFVVYFILFLILSFFKYHLIIYIDTLVVPIFLIITIVASYIVNGFEIWRKGSKRYAQISSGDIINGYSAISDLKMIPKYLAKINMKTKMAVINLLRKKKDFFRFLIMTSLAITIIVINATSGYIIGHSLKESIHGAQGDNVIIIGNTDLITKYSMGYEAFSNSSINVDGLINDSDFLNDDYLFNESIVNGLESNIATVALLKDENGNNIPANSVIWEKRLVTRLYAHEVSAVRITGEYNSYTMYGKDRWGYITIIGAEFKNYTDNWILEGSLNNTDDTAIIGDSLAASFFEAWNIQSIDFYFNNSQPFRYRISGVLYDSFYKGNDTYVRLDSLQSNLHKEGKVNMVVLHLQDNIQPATIKNITDSLDAYIKTELGNNFGAKYLGDVFRENLDSMNSLLIDSYLITIILLISVILGLVYYSLGNFNEKIKDFSIMYALGAPKKMLIRIIFYEQFFIYLVSAGISFGIALFFNTFLLSGNLTRVYPSLFLLFLIWSIIFGIILAALFGTSKKIYKHFKNHKEYSLKLFNEIK
ncbi:MAG: FtsX-like permease family protein [Promethearchaeota archaeon]